MAFKGVARRQLSLVKMDISRAARYLPGGIFNIDMIKIDNHQLNVWHPVRQRNVISYIYVYLAFYAFF